MVLTSAVLRPRNFFFDVHEQDQGHSAAGGSVHDGRSLDQWRRSDLPRFLFVDVIILDFIILLTFIYGIYDYRYIYI